MGAFPLVKEVSAVNLGSRICAGLVGAKRARNASQHHLSWTKIDRIFPARDPDEILQAARLTIGRYAVEKHSVVTRIPKRKSRAARSEEHTSELQSHHDLVCRLLLE